MPAHPPYLETEIKIRYPEGADHARGKLVDLGYEVASPRTLESDQLFDQPSGELRSRDQLLRLRRAGDQATITYKGPADRQRHKSREEIEFDVSDAAALTLVLERLGYRPSFRYEKYRTKFSRPGEPGLITIDETPIGVYLELEGLAEWIDRTATELGFFPKEYVTSSYAALYREYYDLHSGLPQDMIFRGSL